MIEPLELDDSSCRRLTDAIEFIGKRWNAAILLAFARGAERFSEVLHTVPGLSDRMLAVQLRELEAQGAVVRTVIPSTPVQVRYRLTDHGKALLEAVVPLLRVGSRWEGQEARDASGGGAPHRD